MPKLTPQERAARAAYMRHVDDTVERGGNLAGSIMLVLLGMLMGAALSGLLGLLR